MIEYSEIRVKLSELLNRKRFVHSINVAIEAEKLAKTYGFDPKKAYLAGMLHDCVKCLEIPTMEKYIEIYNLKFDDVTMSEKKLWHAPIGANFVEYEFGINDDEIFDAIFYHTTSKPDMSLLTKIIFLADHIEPGRKHHKDLNYINENCHILYHEPLDELIYLAYINLDKAIIFALNMSIRFWISKDTIIHPLSIESRNYLINTNTTSK